MIGAKGEAPRRVDVPEVGWFLLRLVKDGWLVPAQIAHDGERWQAIINGEAKRPHHNPLLAEDVMRIWHYGRRTTEAEYHHRLVVKAFAEANCPDHPAANPGKPMDHRLIPADIF